MAVIGFISGTGNRVGNNKPVAVVVVMVLSVLLVWSGLHQAFQGDRYWAPSNVRTTMDGRVSPNAREGGGGGDSNGRGLERVDILRIIDSEDAALVAVAEGAPDSEVGTANKSSSLIDSGVSGASERLSAAPQEAADGSAPTADSASGAPGAADGSGSGGAASAPTVAITQSDAQTYLYPGCFSSVQAKKCIDTLWSHCNNRGADKCAWKQSVCNYNNHDCLRLTELFPNRTFLFRGDSTLREQFSVWSFYCCPWASPVLKSDANMTYRETLARHHETLGLRSYYHFDYMFDHLLEPVPRLPPEQTIDAVVVGLGMYQAKAITTNQSDRNSIDEIAKTKVRKVVQSVCDFHKAKVGFFVGGWMECQAMKKHKAKAVRQNFLVCPQSAALVSLINKIVRNYLLMQPPRKDGCYVHYIPAMKCRGQKHVCTGDGVHARSGGAYGNTKFQLLFNAARILFQTAPPGR